MIKSAIYKYSMLPKHYIVLDDFYTNPYEIREAVLAMPKNQQSMGNYAGIMTPDAIFTEEHAAFLSHLTNTPVVAGSGLCGKFRFTCKTDQARQKIHFDPGPGQVWAGLVHLSRPEDIQAHEHRDYRCGTIFWRHRSLGLECIPIDDEQLKAIGMETPESQRRFLETDGLDLDLWEETFYVPPRFNRLVLFHPWMFHSPGEAFGDTLENSRLIQTFFLKMADTPAQD